MRNKGQGVLNRGDAEARAGQGSLEYLLLIGGAVLVAVVVIGLLLSLQGTAGEGAKNVADQGMEDIKAAAGMGGGTGKDTTTFTIIDGKISGADYDGCKSSTPLVYPDCDGEDYVCNAGEYCDPADCECKDEAGSLGVGDVTDTGTVPDLSGEFITGGTED